MHIHACSEAEHSGVQQSEMSPGHSLFEQLLRMWLRTPFRALCGHEAGPSDTFERHVAMKQAHTALLGTTAATKQARAALPSATVAPVRPRKAISSAQVTAVEGKIATSVIAKTIVAKMQ